MQKMLRPYKTKVRPCATYPSIEVILFGTPVKTIRDLDTVLYIFVTKDKVINMYGLMYEKL